MLLLQTYAEKKEEGAPEDRRMGVKVRKGEDFLSIAMAMPDEQFTSALESLDREFRKNGVSKFMSTLTPGAQNAIYAASFAWGYENAAKYVQNAMKLDEVKNAANEAERSKAVVESVQSQAGAETKTRTATNFVWGYYNDDMKQAQAEAGKSETFTEKEHEEQKQQHGIVMPLNAAEAVSAGILHGTASPQVLYCSAAIEAAQGAQEQENEERKREHLSRLEQGHGKPRLIVLTPDEMRIKATQETAKEAEGRMAALIHEHNEAERQLEAALAKAGTFTHDTNENVKKVAAMLPAELGRALLSGRGKYAKRKALKKQLEGWLAFSRSGKAALSSLPLGKLLKLASLSSLFR
jgi:hypothetical protein